jgi:hypothetical protein
MILIYPLTLKESSDNRSNEVFHCSGSPFLGKEGAWDRYTILRRPPQLLKYSTDFHNSINVKAPDVTQSVEQFTVIKHSNNKMWTART